MKKLLVYIRDFRLECVLAPLFKLLEASFELIVPLIMAAIIDRGIPSGDTGFIVRMCLWLVVLGGVGLLSSVTAQYFSAKAAIGFSAKLRHVLMAHIQTLSYTELDTVGTSTLITRMNSDINQVQTGVNMCLRLLLRSPFVVFGDGHGVHHRHEMRADFRGRDRRAVRHRVFHHAGDHPDVSPRAGAAGQRNRDDPRKSDGRSRGSRLLQGGRGAREV